MERRLGPHLKKNYYFSSKGYCFNLLGHHGKEKIPSIPFSNLIGRFLGKLIKLEIALSVSVRIAHPEQSEQY